MARRKLAGWKPVRLPSSSLDNSYLEYLSRRSAGMEERILLMMQVL